MSFTKQTNAPYIKSTLVISLCLNLFSYYNFINHRNQCIINLFLFNLCKPYQCIFNIKVNIYNFDTKLLSSYTAF